MWFPNRSDTNRAVQAQKMGRNFGLRKKMNCTNSLAKTKTQLICAFVFVSAKCLLSHNAAHLELISFNRNHCSLFLGLGR